MSDLFISYARDDRERVQPLVAALEARGWSVWWDPNIRAGEDFGEVIEEAIREAGCVLVVWTERSAASHWVRSEAAHGLKRGRLVPVAFGSAEPPLGFSHLHTEWLDAEHPEASPAFEKVVADIAALLDSEGRPAERRPTAPQPARGDHQGGRRAFRLALLVAAVLTLGAVAFWMSGPIGFGGGAPSNVSPIEVADGAPSAEPIDVREILALKHRALDLIGRATEPFDWHHAEAEQLLVHLDAVAVHARFLPDVNDPALHDVRLVQWEGMGQLSRSLRVFLRSWRQDGSLPPDLVEQSQARFTDLFDYIIGVETGAVRPAAPVK